MNIKTWMGRNISNKNTARKFQKPSEVTQDKYLTVLQKRMVLKAMEVEAQREDNNPEPSRRLFIGKNN